VSVVLAFGVSETGDGDIVTLATGTNVTVTAAVPLWPLLVAEIVAVPAPIAVTVPLDDTVATPVLELDQMKVVPAMTPPVSSRPVAASWVVCATVIDTTSGVTTTDATGP
jgi:hypothetical protein